MLIFLTFSLIASFFKLSLILKIKDYRKGDTLVWSIIRNQGTHFGLFIATLLYIFQTLQVQNEITQDLTHLLNKLVYFLLHLAFSLSRLTLLTKSTLLVLFLDSILHIQKYTLDTFSSHQNIFNRHLRTTESAPYLTKYFETNLK